MSSIPGGLERLWEKPGCWGSVSQEGKVRAHMGVQGTIESHVLDVLHLKRLRAM